MKTELLHKLITNYLLLLLFIVVGSAFGNKVSPIPIKNARGTTHFVPPTCPVSNTFSNANGGGTHSFNYSNVETLSIDFDFIDNSFQVEINGTLVHPSTMEMEFALLSAGEVHMVFQSNSDEMDSPWLPNSNGLPRLRLQIDTLGNVFLIGTRTIDSTVMEVMVPSDGTLFNTISFPSGTTSVTVTNLDDSSDDGISGTIIAEESCNPSDSVPPTAPVLSSTGHTDTTANLSWSGATDNIGVTGYRIFKDGVLEATLGNVTTHQVIGLSASTAYSFTVTALDAGGNESLVSNAISVTTDTSSGGGSGSSVWSETGSTASYNGSVAIGTAAVPSGYRLAVEGHIRAREVRVDQDTWPDYVFQKDYPLASLGKIEEHIKEKGHLPNMPSAKEVRANGMEIGEMNRLLLEKIEELTLHAIAQHKAIEKLQAEINALKTDKK